MGLRENQLDHSSIGMCCRARVYMGAWIEINNNVMQRTITNHVVAPAEVRGLKYSVEGGAYGMMAKPSI